MPTTKLKLSATSDSNTIPISPISTATQTSTPAFTTSPLTSSTSTQPTSANMTGLLEAPLSPGGTTVPTSSSTTTATTTDSTTPTGSTTTPTTPTTPTAPTSTSGFDEAAFREGLAQAQATADKIAAGIAELKAREENQVSAEIVADSEPEAQQEKLTTDIVNKLAEEEAVIRKTGDASIKMIDDYMAVLEKRREQEVAAIEASFDNQQALLADAQKREKGATSVGIARLGGYLGGSASGTGVMLNLAKTHRDEVSALEGKKAAAIQAAQNAITDKQFDLARLRIEEVRGIEEAVLDRKDKFFNQMLKLSEENRRQDEFFREKVSEDLEAWASLSLDDQELTLDPRRVAEIDEYYGVPGFTQQYLGIARQSALIDSEKDAIKYRQDTLNFLQDIPKGQIVSFPDGSVFEGMGSSKDISTFRVTDDSGRVRVISYDKANNTATTVDLGNIGGTSSSGGGGGVQSEEIKEAGTVLDTLRDPDTGYVPIDAYVGMYHEFIMQHGGGGSEFLKQFDPVIYTGREKNKLRISQSTDDE